MKGIVLSGVRLLSYLGIVLAVVVSAHAASPAAIEALRRRPEVIYAEPDFVVRAQATFPNDPYFGNQWGLNSSSGNDINAPEAWSVEVYRNGTRIATVDNTGTYTDKVGNKGGTYTYQVCEPGGQCSNFTTVTF